MSFLDRIREANTGHGIAYQPLLVHGKEIGRLLPDAAARLLQFPSVFTESGNGVGLVAGLDAEDTPCEDRTRAVGSIMEALRAQGEFPGWRDELFAAQRRLGEQPAFLVERAALPMLGIRGWGVHVNGYVERDGRTSMWIARRSANKPTWPGLLDQMVAGGQPAGLTPAENVIKECQEEAGLPADLAARARPTGAITYCYDAGQGLRPDVVLTYDLPLPASFQPVNQDGEVESFDLIPVEDVAELVRDTRQFKFNCSLVIIDFLIRRGHLSPDEPGYLELVQGLRMDPLSL